MAGRKSDTNLPERLEFAGETGEDTFVRELGAKPGVEGKSPEELVADLEADDPGAAQGFREWFLGKSD